jgi:cation diffusion facilitator CzcD-associated flavoprotein CzcO
MARSAKGAPMTDDALDVLVVGAGISGISAAWHLQTMCPDRRFAIVEAREALGGTWDLFRYPGVRSDSDMYTLGFSFKPWRGAQSIAEAPEILQYLNDTVREFGIDRHIRYGQRVQRASWSSTDATWTVTLQRSGSAEPVTQRCRFLFMCSGYYRYDQGYTPQFAGIESFQGRVVHPQAWRDDVPIAGQRVVVIGSGATAVTLVPAIAKSAALVTMLQRSPTYMLSRPARDAIARGLQRALPHRLAAALARWKNLLLGMYLFRLCRRKPAQVKDYLIKEVRKLLPSGYDVQTHFTPRYNPWEQRLCLVPDSDLFESIASGRAQVVTDEIERFTAHGVLLKSGRELAADVVVTATGLQLQQLGGAALEVDGRAIDPADLVVYKGLMYAGLPNFAATFGYTNASWTLKADLTSRYVCRLLQHMKASGARVCTPRLADAAMALEPFVDFSSGYFQRELARLPKQGRVKPWKLNQNYLRDIVALRFSRIDDGVLQFGR